MKESIILFLFLGGIGQQDYDDFYFTSDGEMVRIFLYKNFCYNYIERNVSYSRTNAL
ncbi:hypothetical protein [Myroides odoratus]|uniref:hypothetical protein n=1 Tax=Myroides odoratus TaxID=256 RepID=UPI00334159A9